MKQKPLLLLFTLLLGGFGKAATITVGTMDTKDGRLPYDLLVVASSADLGLRSIHIREVEIKYDDYNHFVPAAFDIGESFTPVMYADRTTDPKTGNV